MSEKEAKDYFKKLMNDTQNKIDDVNDEKSTNEDVKIDNNEHNQEQNMRWKRGRNSITSKSFQNRS